MKMFDEMAVGEVFWFTDDGPEFSYEAYKVGDEAAVELRNATRRFFVNELGEYQSTGRVIKVSPDNVTDLERVAMTLIDSKLSLFTSQTVREFVTHLYDQDFTQLIDASFWEDKSASEYDRQAALLGCAVARYRMMGRPEGDFVSEIAGTGVGISGSLAAAIVEYVSAIRAEDRYQMEKAGQ